MTLGEASVKVFAVPGHTAGSAAYLTNVVLFLGDSADVTSDGEIKGAAWLFADDQTENRASLVRLNQRLTQENADVEAIVFSHSGVLANGLAQLTAFAQQNQ